MSEKNKSELMHIQNELLGDIKNVEIRVNDKIRILNQSFEENKVFNEQKIKILEKTLNALIQKFEALPKIDPSKDKKDENKILLLNKKIEDSETRLEIKIKDLNTNLKESIYKYDRAIIDNFTIPGLIGPKAPFKTVRDLLETTYKKIMDSSKVKEKQEFDLKLYKEKLENIINNNKKELELLEIQMKAYYNTKIKEQEKIYLDKFDVFEDRFNAMRVENGKIVYDIFEKYKEITAISDEINESLKKTFDQYHSDFAQHRNIINEENDNFKKKFEEIMKKFEENYNKFEKDYNNFEEGLKIVKEHKVNYTEVENKVKELEKSILIWKRKRAIDYFEKNETTDLTRSNFLSGMIEEDEKNPNINNLIKKLDLTKIKSEKEYRITQAILKSKGYQISEENEENKKINNIVYDSDYFRDSNSNNNFSVDICGVKKAKMPIYRVRSGKIFNQYPFISHDIIYDYKSNKKSGKETDRIDNLKTGRSNLKKNNIQKEIEFPYHNHKYRYLEKKIDILGKSLVDNINKIIVQVNLLKNNKCNKSNNTENVEKTPKEKEEMDDEKIHSIQNKNFFKKTQRGETKFDISNLKNASINFKYRKINSKISQKLKIQKKNDE